MLQVSVVFIIIAGLYADWNVIVGKLGASKQSV